MHLQGIYIWCIWYVLGNRCVWLATTKSQSPQWWRRQTYSVLGWRCGELGLGWFTRRVSSCLPNASYCYWNWFSVKGPSTALHDISKEEAAIRQRKDLEERNKELRARIVKEEAENEHRNQLQGKVTFLTKLYAYVWSLHVPPSLTALLPKKAPGTPRKSPYDSLGSCRRTYHHRKTRATCSPFPSKYLSSIQIH